MQNEPIILPWIIKTKSMQDKRENLSFLNNWKKFLSLQDFLPPKMKNLNRNFKKKANQLETFQPLKLMD
mgnify:CR=1 FL=1